MKKYLWVLLLLFNIHSSYAKQALDQMAAVVNDDIITRSELNATVKIVKQQLQQQGAPIPAARDLQKAVLDQLINKHLQLQVVKQANIKVSEEELNQAVVSIAKQNNMTVAEFYRRIANEGMSPASYKKEMREQLALQKLQQAELVNHIHILPEEVRAYAKRLPTNKNKIYDLQDILIPLSDQPSAEELNQAQQLAQTMLHDLRNKKFDAITQHYPQIKLTLLTNKLISDVPSAFTQAVKPLKKGDVTQPIQTGNGLHLVRVIDLKNNAQALSQQEIENRIGQKKLAEALQIWLAKLRSQAYIVNYLDEPQTL